LLAFGAAALGVSIAADGGTAPPPAVRFTDAPRQAAEFITYYHAIPLTAAQEAIKQEALSKIPAPCCGQFSIATCCCPCNLAKSAWGLAHFLIAKQGYAAPRVRATVEEWLQFSNPGGYSGDACFTRGCARPFDHNGCGGMDEHRIL
jgi:hypothetical protein